jgi:hypothetical protein
MMQIYSVNCTKSRNEIIKQGSAADNDGNDFFYSRLCWRFDLLNFCVSLNNPAYSTQRHNRVSLSYVI